MVRRQMTNPTPGPMVSPLLNEDNSKSKYYFKSTWYLMDILRTERNNLSFSSSLCPFELFSCCCTNVLFTFCQTRMLGVMSEGVSVPGVLLAAGAVPQVTSLPLGPRQREHGDWPGRGPGRPGGELPGAGVVRHAVPRLGPQPRLV